MLPGAYFLFAGKKESLNSGVFYLSFFFEGIFASFLEPSMLNLISYFHVLFPQTETVLLNMNDDFMFARDWIFFRYAKQLWLGNSC